MEIGAHTVLAPRPADALERRGDARALPQPQLADGPRLRRLRHGVPVRRRRARASSRLAAACGYNSARSRRRSSRATHGHDCAETVPPLDAYALRTPNDFEITTTLAQMKAMVTNAENNGGGWVPLELHDVCNGPNDPLLPPRARCTARRLRHRARALHAVPRLAPGRGRRRAACRSRPCTRSSAARSSRRSSVDPGPGAQRATCSSTRPSSRPARAPSRLELLGAPSATAPATRRRSRRRATPTRARRRSRSPCPPSYESWAYNLIAPALDLAQCSPTAAARAQLHVHRLVQGQRPDQGRRLLAQRRQPAGRASTGARPARGRSRPPRPGRGPRSRSRPRPARPPSARASTSTAPRRSHSYTIDDTSLVDDALRRSPSRRAGTGNGIGREQPGRDRLRRHLPGGLRRRHDRHAHRGRLPPGSSFTGWSGACTGASATCTVTMSAARSATATFTRLPPQLAVVTRRHRRAAPSASSAGGIACGVTCSGQLHQRHEQSRSRRPPRPTRPSPAGAAPAPAPRRPARSP